MVRLLSVETLQDRSLVGSLVGMEASYAPVRSAIRLRPSQSSQVRKTANLLSLELSPNAPQPPCRLTRFIHTIPSTSEGGLLLAPTVEQMVSIRACLQDVPQPMLHHPTGYIIVETPGFLVHSPHLYIPIAQHLGSLIPQQQWKCSSREDVIVKRKRLREELNVSVSRQSESKEEGLKVDCHRRQGHPISMKIGDETAGLKDARIRNKGNKRNQTSVTCRQGP